MDSSNKQATKVFATSHLLENILSHVEFGIMRNLGFRLVSKSFNKEILRQIQKSHRKIKIEYIGKIFGDLRLTITDPLVAQIFVAHNRDVRVFVNNDQFKLTEIDGYFKFIKKLEIVKIEQITTKNLWRLKETIQNSLHDAIVNTLIGKDYSDIQSVRGLSDLCHGCSSCVNISRNCQEYGSLNLSSIIGTGEQFHFKSLTLSDSIFEGIHGLAPTSSKEECFRLLNWFITSFKSCDHLIIELSESTVLVNEDNIIGNEALNAPLDHQHSPREIVKMMINKWKVKSIGIKFINVTRSLIVKNLVDQKNFFTKLKLNAPRSSVNKSELDRKLERVDVDLSDSSKCATGITHDNSDWNHYKNLIANIRNEFPTNQISIKFSHWMQKNQVDIQEVFNNILKTVFKEEQKNLKVVIRYHADVKSFSRMNPVTNQEELIEFSSSILFKSRELSFSVENHSIYCSVRDLSKNENSFVEKKKVGRRCNIVDSQNNCIIHLDVFIDEKDLTTVKNQMKKQPNSFLSKIVSL
ncbi:hypothetical protein GCK72_020294 [Caenorhabditis remanei]|uniref:Uncharacterized protein n=1 Tax=Caenorhabditis remanei TaxID=31234 RepID=A0A6A5GES5_CAERE|nr:hypothetical protein GCK72_020294 [Caenorhabditis remanei]KAF1753737.1 hypothetical protein GCK72_020294 [Caenorhabditis remanei]